MTKKRIAVIGCVGKMGQTLCKYLSDHKDFSLDACVDITRVGEDIGEVIGLGKTGIIIENDIKSILADIDMAVDFTTPASVVSNAIICLQQKVPVLIGTTGISAEDSQKLDKLARENDTSVMIVPNFAIGAILMMDFAKKAARYMKAAEIIEQHHPQKLDKPSGTALKTRLGMIEELRNANVQVNEDSVPIHSVRLPGLVAHQTVIFGDVGQTLTIRHDSLSRDSFMPGIALALNRLTTFKGLKIGLDL
ncbi:MAG: 4-hydroxy-tetrahydrodipicolinate reductase [Candidatus Rifleibacteriota bacterium]